MVAKHYFLKLHNIENWEKLPNEKKAMHSLLDCKECIKNDETKFITKDYLIKSCQEKAKAEEVGWRTK